MSANVFSDAWYRVAGMHVSLLPTVRVRPQTFRGQPWYVLEDSFSGKFFRVTPQAHAFISALTPQRTVEDVWNEFLRQHPGQAPGQEEVIQLLSQLHVSNLLYLSHQPDNEAIGERQRKTRRKEFLSRLMAFLFFRIPLWDPDAWLERMRPLIRWSTGVWMAGLWLLVMLLGLMAAIENKDALGSQSQGLLALGNLPWLYLCMAVMKLLHEFGHAFFCKRFGGEVHTFGLMFLLFTPLPYVDATTSWAFGSRWQRALVGAAGMLVEFFLAALGALVWANTGPGLVNSLAFNVMIIGSVSSLLFNGNPLLRFDAYYILSDVLEIPNLYQKGQQQWLHFADRHLLGTRTSRSPAVDLREWWWITAYGALSFLYLILITVGIVLFLLDQWFAIGLLTLGMTVFAKLLLPLGKLYTHLSSPVLAPNRRRAVTVVASSCAIVLIAGFWLPLPHWVTLHGMLEATDSSLLYARTEGRLEHLALRNGQRVEPGDLIARFSNSELDADIDITQQQLRETELQQRQAMLGRTGDLPAIQGQRQSLLERMAELHERRRLLDVRARQAGEWVAPELHEKQGSWLQRGQALGEIVDRSRFRFLAVVPQEQADELFRLKARHGELRLHGQADRPLDVDELTLIPVQQHKLSSPALGWMGGGEIAVKTDERGGAQTTESFYALHAALPAGAAAGLTALHGQTGLLRIDLPAEPLFTQVGRAFKQMVQKRYGY